MRIFQDWVADYGGPEKLALELRVTSFAVRHWLKRKGSPKLATIRKLAALSKGALTFESIARDTSPPAKKGGKKC